MSSKSSADEYVSLAALILAGGKSSRMGEPKHGVLLSDGRSMIANVLDALIPLNIPIHISVPKGQSSDPILDTLPYPKIEDEEEYQGPLVAIAHGLQKIPADRLLVVCCDQPLLNSEFLSLLTAHTEKQELVFYETMNGEELTPFPGIYPQIKLAEILNAIENGERSPRKWLLSAEKIFCKIDPNKRELISSLNSKNDINSVSDHFPFT